MKLLCTKDYSYEGQLYFKKWNKYEVVGIENVHSRCALRCQGEHDNELYMYLEDLGKCFDIGLIEEECIAEQKKDIAPKRKRGRPKGSKNKSKPVEVVTTTIGKYTLENHEMLEALWPKGSK